MGNKYNHHLHHQTLHYRSSYLPMLCSKPSIKDVRLPKRSSSSLSDDPLSPRVGCMGQVKRNNKVVGFPTSHKWINTTTASKDNNNTIKYFKLKKLFSSKNLITTTTSSSSSRRELIMDGASGSKFDDDNDNYVSIINVVDLDPPLPVSKRVQQPADSRDAVNLWKRRSGGGVALKSLQLQQLHTPNHSLQPTSV